jgi:hypothetical protein
MRYGRVIVNNESEGKMTVTRKGMQGEDMVYFQILSQQD